MTRMAISGMASGRQLIALGLQTNDLAKAMGVAGDQVAKTFKKEEWEDRLITIEAALQKFSGTAEAMATTASGSFGRLKEVFHQALEQMGNELTPVLGRISDFTAKLMELGLKGNTLDRKST